MRAWTVFCYLLREKRTVLGIVLLAAVAAYTGWRRMAPPPAEMDTLPQAAVRDTDYTLEGFTLTLLDEQGRLGVSLTGGSLEHDPREKRSHIQAPRAVVTGAGDTRWEGNAREGWIADDGDELYLSGNVRLNRPASESGSPLELTTETLTLFPDRDQAQTPAFVTIVRPGASLEGTGMQVDLARGTYRLNAQVRGRYDTPDSN